MAQLRIIVALALVVAWWQKDTLDDRAITHDGASATLVKAASRMWMATTPPSPAKEWIRTRDEWLDALFNPAQDYSSPLDDHSQSEDDVAKTTPTTPDKNNANKTSEVQAPHGHDKPTELPKPAKLPEGSSQVPSGEHSPVHPTTSSNAALPPTPPQAPASTPQPPSSATPTPESTSFAPIKRILVVGDSMSGDVGMSLRHLAAKHKKQTGVDVQIIDAHRHSTGLVVPSYYDWPRELPAILKKNEPQVVVFMVGANDGQSMRLANQTWVAPGAPGWSEEYQRRVKQVAQTIPASSKLVWLDLPPVRLKSLQDKTAGVNSAVNAALASCTHCVHLETRAAFGGNSYVENDKLRARDGVHYARSGSALVAAKVWSKLGLPVYD